MHYDKPTEGVWSVLKGALANLAVHDIDQLAAVVKSRLKQIQYRPDLIEASSPARPGPHTPSVTLKIENR